jgi:hypothetical protein
MLNLVLFLLSTAMSVADALPTIESLQLTSHLGLQIVSCGFLTDQDGTEYDVSQLLPYNELLSPERFVAFANGTKGMDYLTGEIFDMPVYRAMFEDGTILLAQKDEHGIIVYAEIRHERGVPDTYFVKTEDCKVDELRSFADSQMHESVNVENFFEEALGPDFPRETIDANETNLPEFAYERGDGTSADCPYFKVVKVGIVYDAELCTKYGGKNEARSRIMMVVAAASVLFENDMCVKLQLTDVYTPDRDCSSASTFASFPRDKACGSGDSEAFIRYFRDWMNANRNSIGLDPQATFHTFTGFPPRGTLGCAYIGTVCQYPQYAYGVDYMSSIHLSTQSVIFAHELGHNLGARHLTSEDATGFKYLMKSSLQNPHDGFSQITIDKILGHLDSNEVTCDEIAFRDPTSSPTNHPTLDPSELPSFRPTMIPTHQPTTSPTELPSADPTFTPSAPPSVVPTDQPTTSPTKLPSADPTFTPSAPPSVVPTDQPTNSPTKLPSADPSFIPSAPPSPLPSQMPSSVYHHNVPTQCSIKQGTRSSMCILESQDALFGCYEAISLMSVMPNPWCSLEQPFFATVAFHSCKEKLQVDEISNDEDRILRKKVKGKKDADDRAGVTTDSIDPNTGKKISIEYSNDQDLDSFLAEDCTVGCALVGDHVCFLSGLDDDDSDDQKIYVLTFSATFEGDTQLFTTEVIIQRAESTNTGCDQAQTVCFESY